MVKNKNLFKYNWVQILHNFQCHNVNLTLGTVPPSNSNSNAIEEEEEEKPVQTKVPLGILDLNLFMDKTKMESIIEERKEYIKVQVESQNKKLEELLSNTRVLFVYTDEEGTGSHKKELEILKKKGVLFTYLDLSGKVSLKNKIREKFKDVQLPCVIVENKTIVLSGKTFDYYLNIFIINISLIIIHFIL